MLASTTRGLTFVELPYVTSRSIADLSVKFTPIRLGQTANTKRRNNDIGRAHWQRKLHPSQRACSKLHGEAGVMASKLLVLGLNFRDCCRGRARALQSANSLCGGGVMPRARGSGAVQTRAARNSTRPARGRRGHSEKNGVVTCQMWHRVHGGT